MLNDRDLPGDFGRSGYLTPAVTVGESSGEKPCRLVIGTIYLLLDLLRKGLMHDIF
jgi:hypothetical protein